MLKEAFTPLPLVQYRNGTDMLVCCDHADLMEGVFAFRIAWLAPVFSHNTTLGMREAAWLPGVGWSAAGHGWVRRDRPPAHEHRPAMDRL